MDALYKSLSNCSIDVLDQQQILKLSEFICDNYSLATAVGQQQSPSLSGETAAHNSASYEAYLASRILIQLVICARGDVTVTKFIGKVYIRIVTSTCVEMEEFILLGQMIVTMHDIHGRYSAKCFHNCSIALPFQDLACRPTKYSVSIPSMDSLMHLQDFWCEAVAQLYSPSMALQSLQLLMQSTVDPTSLLPSMVQALGPVSAGCRSVVSVCAALSSTSRYSTQPLHSFNGEVVHRCLSHLLDWTERQLDTYMTSSSSSQHSNNSKSNPTLKTTIASCLDDVYKALRSMEDAVHSLLSHWSDHSCSVEGPTASWMVRGLVERILCLLERTIKPHRPLLAAAAAAIVPPSPSTKSQSIVRAIVVHLSQVLSSLFRAQHAIIIHSTLDEVLVDRRAAAVSHLMGMCHSLIRMPFTVDTADAVMTTMLVNVRSICPANTFVEGDKQITATALLLLHVASEAQLLVGRLHRDQVAGSSTIVGTPISQPRIVLLDTIMQVMVPLELFVVVAAADGDIVLTLGGGLEIEAGAVVGLGIGPRKVDDRDVQTQLADRLRVYYELYVDTFRKYLLSEEQCVGDVSADDRLEAAWMLLLSVHRMMSLVDARSIDAVVDGSLLDLLGIALDATCSGAICSLNQTASLTSDEVRKIERSVRSMAARGLHIDGCISSSLPACDPTCYWFVRWLMVLCLPSTAATAAAAVSVSVDRRSSRKRPRREELQADGGQLDIFAEVAATDLKRKSVSVAERSVGSLRGPLRYPFLDLFHRTVEEQGLSSAVLIVCCEKVVSTYRGSSRGEDLQQSHLSASSSYMELLRATLSLLPPSIALIESRGGHALSDCLLSSLIKLVGIAVRAFLEKLEPELRELEPSFRYSVATRHLLKDSLMLSQEEVLNRPDYSVFLVHYIERIRLWKAYNSSKLGQRSSGPVVGSSLWSDGLMHALGRLIVDSVISILPFVELGRNASGPLYHSDEAMRLMGESEASFSDYGDSAPLETPTGGRNQQSVGARLAWELLLVSKAALSVISCFCSREVSRDGDGNDAMQVAIAAGSEAVDAKAIKALIDQRVCFLDSHVCMVKAAQYVAILLLELSHRCCQAGGTTMTADIVDKTHCKFVVGLLSVPFSSKSPGRKIATIAIARFVQYGSLLCPEVACYFLSALCMSRCEEEQTNSPTQEDEDEDEEDSKADEVAGLFTAELLALSEGGFLSSLLVSNAAYFTDQLVLPALRHLRTNGPAVIDVLQLLDKVVGRSDAGISYLEFCKDRIFARLAVDCMTNPSTAELIKALKEYQAELPFTLPKKNLLDEVPTLYRSLLREMEDVSEKLLVESVVFSKLKSLAALMGVAISESVAITVGVTDHGPRGSNLSVATYHRMLLPILWDLGRGSPADVTTGSAVPSRSSDADTQQQQQLKAVRVLSFQAKENSWQLLSRRNRHIAEELKSAVADKLQVDFLYILANLLVKDWQLQSELYQDQCLRCLRHVIALLKPADLAKFLPKILIVVDSALEGGSCLVRRSAVQVTAGLCEALPLAILGEHLSSLVVGLLPLLELNDKYHQEHQKLSTGGGGGGVPISVALAGFDLSLYGRLCPRLNCYDRPADTYGEDSIYSMSNFIPSLSPQMLDTVDGHLSDIMIQTCAVAFAADLERYWISKIKSDAIEVMKSLFITRRGDLQGYIRSIAYIPRIPELSSIYTLHQQEVKALTLDESLRLLCSMTTHASALVRLVAVDRLCTVCKEHKVELDQLIHIASSATTQSNASSASEKDSVLSLLLKGLLLLCSRESDHRVQLAAACCLGEIGAIDPSRVKVGMLLPTGTDTSSVTSRIESGSKSGSGLPWRVSLFDFGMFLLEHHLVPGLRSAAGSASQDKSGFAIQIILRCLADNITDNDSTDAPRSITTQQQQSISGDSSRPMPLTLRQLLLSKGLLDVSEPFWSTSYTMSENYPVRRPPIFTPGLSFSRWISLLTRYLIWHSTGPLAPIFMACRGVVRIRHELCQFLLPHLIVNVLSADNSASSDTAATNDISLALSEELRLVLRGNHTVDEDFDGSTMVAEGDVASVTSLSCMTSFTTFPRSKSDQRCVQSIFSLLDTLDSWVTLHSTVIPSKGAAPRATMTSNQSSKSDQSSTLGSGQHDAGMDAVRALLQSIPKALLSIASMEINAYTRALRYIEISAREGHRANRISGYHASTVASSKSAIGSISNGTIISSNHASSHESILGTDRFLKADRAVVMSGCDRASGELPVLSAVHIDKMIAICANLEDADALQGVVVMSHVNGYASTMRHRILELELTDDWLGALQEYDLVLNSHLFSLSLQYHCRDKEKERRGPEVEVAVAVPVAHPDRLLHLDTIAKMEQQKLRCMIELGQYEAVIEQTSSLMLKVSELQSALLPLATEASWRLMRWGDLEHFLSKYDQSQSQGSSSSASTVAVPTTSPVVDTSLPMLDTDLFQLSVGKIILSMQKQDSAGFYRELENARKQTMLTLSAASMESYGRAYPMLTRLHMLHELSSGYEVMLQTTTEMTMDGGIDKDKGKKRSSLREDLNWNNRLHFMLPSVPQQSTLLAMRRCVLGLCEMPELSALNLLALSNRMRQLGKFDGARVAVRHAESCGLNPEVALLQECRILRDTGNINKALMQLEPVQLDLPLIRAALAAAALHRSSSSSSSTSGSTSSSSGKSSGSTLPAFLDSQHKRHLLSERIQLATQLMIDGRTQQGDGIISRYETVIALNSHWPQAYFDLARYYEFLYQDVQSRQKADLHELSRQSLKKSSHSNADAVEQLRGDTQMMFGYFRKAVERYSACITVGVEFVMQALPRMLSLWLSFTSLQDPTGILNTAPPAAVTTTSLVGRSNGSSSSSSSYMTLTAAQLAANRDMARTSSEVSAAVWFVGTSQLVSRILHRNPDTVAVITILLQKILQAFPRQGIWHISCLLKSYNSDRKKIAKKVVQDTIKYLNENGLKDDSYALVESLKVFDNLISLANHQCKERKIRWSFPSCAHMETILVPTKAVLHFSNPLSILNHPSNKNRAAAMRGAYTPISTVRTSNYDYDYYSSDHMYVASFQEVVDVASSKAKPKTIYIRTVCGRVVKFLCKLEKDGDLRKDARMMEFNATVNRLLTDDAEGRKRNLHVRTFAVICLNEECGLLEWVNNTDCIRHLITAAHHYWLDLYPMLQSKDIHQPFIDLQKDNADNLCALVDGFRSLMTSLGYRPCFHRWFLEQFPDPTAWYEARTAYIRSAAVWSAVGHVVGLGDRHTENILLDTTNGECVHVDFDCLFDKGLALLRPEIVPFRLTPNMVDAMGCSGVEGAYRRSMEVTLHVLREHKDTLLSVLEPFLRDPTVAWGRSGRAQRNPSEQKNQSAGQQFADHENKEASEMLGKIGDRLVGKYNIFHPGREMLVRGAILRNESPPVRGVGASLDDSHSLSVSGYVQRLIDEATAIENLAQMYVGWQPWT